ncbi:MAG: reverse transcriptase domain-containing protein, partial [Bacteroidota bacterium]
MVVVKKKDGRPRRTVDYQQLNAQCLREPNYGESPFHTARRVPANSWKSTFDAVDGYHSVELDEESSKLTTFITPWGRFRYLCFPQGHCSAGDAFNGCVQHIVSKIPRLVRIVDDICIHDESIEDAFWHAWQVLSVCTDNGIVINQSKFQFCCKEIQFAGLSITPEGVQPSKKMLAAILNFPPPTDISKARAFFGLVNQVQWCYANSSEMAPFRDLVRPNSSFTWNDELKKLFDKCKEKIIGQVRQGVQMYDTKRATCLQTDFSKNGLGYLLLQKYCDCAIDAAPLCCKSGWKLVFAGSRFTKGAEARYAPTEGEALAVSWALNHSHLFTMGCQNLIISTDHRPLLGIFNNKPL